MSTHLPAKTWFYFLAQSINLTTAVMSVSMAALVGASLAPTPGLSTVPYGFQFLFVMLLTWPAARLMALIGRKKSFLYATIPLALSGVAGYLAIKQQLFILLIVSHSLLGIYIAFANFNRFAATDNIPDRSKPKAISLVVAGGVIAAITGPFLTSQLKNITGFPEFSACYAVFTVLAIISLIIHYLVKENNCLQNNPPLSQKIHWEMLRGKQTLLLAILVAAIGYSIMNLLMIQTSMHMSNLHVHFSDVSSAIQWHVLAMFAPSFFTGAIIQKIGIKTVIITGISLLLLSSALNISGNDYTTLMVALIILGLGWNFTYVGGSALLAQETAGMPSAVKMQGINDLCISIMATIGAFSPAVLLAWLGWKGTNIVSISICVLLLMYSIFVFGIKYQRIVIK